MAGLRSIICVLSWGLLRGAILTVSADSTAEYVSIQGAMDAAAIGDTVLVSSGTYIENLDYNGKDIAVCSHYLLDPDPAYIHTTIVDGNQSGSVVKFDSWESRAAVLNGFTLTNGSGTPFYSEPGDYLSGGGIFIQNSSPSILNCLITKNNAKGFGYDYGGGICIATNTYPFLSNLTVTQNFSASAHAGGIVIFSSGNVEFDPVNRCSVYLNWAGGYNDIRHGGFNPNFDIVIYLDTATVADPTSYFISIGPNDSLDIASGKITPVASDLYVDPVAGLNTNSGTSVNEPLKHIHYALALVQADAAAPRTIHLAPGVYSFTGSDALFPLNLRSYVSLYGAGKEETIFDLEGSMNPALMARDYKRDYTLSSFQIRNAERYGEHDSGFLVQIEQNTNVLITDILFTQNSMSRIISNVRRSGAPVPDSTSVTVRGCDFINNSGSAGAYGHQFYTYENCRFLDGVPYSDGTGSSGTRALSVGGHAGNASPDQIRRIERCIFTNNLNETTWWPPPSQIISVGTRKEADFIHCTFADNQVLDTGAGILEISDHWRSVRFVNCLFWGNSPFQMYIDGRLSGEEVIISHSIIQDSTQGINGIGNYSVTWLEGNMDADPEFTMIDPTPYALSPTSPAIDAGTAFFVWDGDTILDLAPEDYIGTAPDIGAYEYGGLNIAPESTVPDKIMIQSIYPNPFNSSTTIQYELPYAAHIVIKLYDIRGRLITEPFNGWISAGQHSVSLRGDNLASGTYFLRVEGQDQFDTHKIVLLK